MPRLARSRAKADNVPVRRSARRSTPNAPVIEVMEDSDRSRSKTAEKEERQPARRKQTISRRLPEESDEEQEEEYSGEENEQEQGQDEDEEMNVDQEEDEDEDEEEDDQEDELPSSPSEIAPPPKSKPVPTPRLKIKLKVPVAAQSNATPTPSDEMPLKVGRKGHPKHADVESEDEEDDDSSSYAGPTRLTQRQAALAGMVEAPGHVVLEETVSKKKKHLNEAELALKREETARKRKNLSVKKLEDEKTETINRLLKKQSRRGKKAVPVDDEDAEQDAEDVPTSLPTPVIPTSFQWVSSSKPGSSFLSFSVPQSLLDTLNASAAHPSTPSPAPKEPPICDIDGCSQPRKYKLVRDPTRGGCGMEHLKALQAAV